MPPPRWAANVTLEGAPAGKRGLYHLADPDDRGEALMLVLQGSVALMRDGAPASVPGAVWIDDHGLIAAVTPLDAEPGASPRRLGSPPVG